MSGTRQGDSAGDAIIDWRKVAGYTRADKILKGWAAYDALWLAFRSYREQRDEIVRLGHFVWFMTGLMSGMCVSVVFLIEGWL